MMTFATRSILALVLSVVAPVFLVPAQAGTVPTDLVTAKQLPDIIQPLIGSVVNIAVLKPAGSDPSDSSDQIVPDRALGSGFLISPLGYVVTNKHVVEGGYDVTVSFEDGSTYSATIVATNQRPDLAVLKITADHPFPYVKFGDSEALRVGEPVIAIGNPLGLTSSVSVGVVSALNRDANMTMIDDFIQTDAAINHGNSGGPLFNLKGEVIGVNWAIYTPGSESGSAGLGLAIPSKDAEWVIGQMKQFGRLRAGFVGFRLQQVTPDLQRALGLPSRTGGIVTAIIPDTPAAKSGIIEGDVILALNGREPRDVRALLRDLSASTPGGSVLLKVWHEGATKTVEVKVASWPQNMFDPAGLPLESAAAAARVSTDLGLKLAAADAKALKGFSYLQDRASVAITGVAANSPAADMRLASGDFILSVGSERVDKPADVLAKIDAARRDGRKSIVLLVVSHDAPHWIVMPLTGR